MRRHASFIMIAILLPVAVVLLPACGKSKPAPPPATPKATPVPTPTPKPLAETLNELAPETPPFEKLRPVILFRESDFNGMGVMVNESFIVTAVDRFPPKKSVADIGIKPGGERISKDEQGEEGADYFYQEVAPEVSSKYTLLRAMPNHAAQLDAAIAEPGPRYAIRGFEAKPKGHGGMSFKAEKEKEYISILTGRRHKTNVSLDLENTKENRPRVTQVALAVNSTEEPVEIGYGFSTPGERLVIVNRIEPLTNDLKSSLSLVGATIPDAADKLAIGGLLPRYLDYEEKYGLLLGSMSEESPSKKYEPVFIYRNDEFHGCGTLAHDGDSTPTIISTRHQFSEGDQALFAYQKLRPLDDETLHPLQSVAPCSHDGLDIVIAQPGMGGELHGVPEAKLTFDPEEVEDRSFISGINLKSKRAYTSLLTGLKYDGYELLDGEGKSTPYIMLFYTIIVGVGESGSGFERDDGRLFTLRGGVDLRDQYREELAALGLEIGDEVDHIIFGAMVPEGDL